MSSIETERKIQPDTYIKCLTTTCCQCDYFVSGTHPIDCKVKEQLESRDRGA